MKLTDSGRFVFSKEHELLSRGLKKLNQDDKEKNADENVSDTPRSIITSIPGSFYSSPRDSLDNPQLNLSKVDLVLDGRFDIHRYLIDLLTECK